jgi:putative transposase
MNAYVERFVQSIKTECLDHFLVFGTQHLNHLCREYVDYYHSDRPHQGVDNQLLIRRATPKPDNDQGLPTLRDIRCHARLGGLLKSYHRQAS